MNADQKLTAKMASLPTEQLVEISMRLTLDTSAEAIIVCNRAERELSRRMTEADFIAHMDACEALLDAAA